MDLDQLAGRRPPVRIAGRTLPPASTLRWRPAGWTAAAPTVPGLYHYRDPADPGQVYLACVRRTAAGVLVSESVHGHRPVAGLPGEWAGPLTKSLPG